mgnify:CR=1 FL=1
MNIKIRALIKTLKMLGIATVVPFIVIMILQLDPEILLYMFITGFFGFMLWMVYSMNLSSLEHEETLKQIKERNDTALSSIVKE